MSQGTTRVHEFQAFYTVHTGMLLRQDGKTSPSSLDEIEMLFGEDALADVMSLYGHWHDLILTPTPNPLENLSADEIRKRLCAAYDEAQRECDREYDRIVTDASDYHAACARRDRIAAQLVPYLQPIKLPVAKFAPPTNRPAA